ncbi:MAG: leucine-rich repeat domain-containing protein [Firmicutes bacterium]|nr:leucine-rich repeat domain-containing protein [Bacillota bacterium]
MKRFLRLMLGVCTAAAVLGANAPAVRFGGVSLGTVSVYAAETAVEVEGGNIYVDENGAVTRSDYTVTNADIPEKAGDITITSIGKNAFAGHSTLKSVSLPKTVVSIGSQAFAACSALESITMQEGLTTIYSSAFVSCSALKSIFIPASEDRSNPPYLKAAHHLKT